MTPATELTVVSLRPETLARLKSLAARTGVPVSAYVRQAVEDFVAEHERPRPPLADMLTRGAP
jgi:predicted DNA-binding protein